MYKEEKVQSKDLCKPRGAVTSHMLAQVNTGNRGGGRLLFIVATDALLHSQHIHFERKNRGDMRGLPKPSAAGAPQGGDEEVMGKDEAQVRARMRRRDKQIKRREETHLEAGTPRSRWSSPGHWS